MINKKYIFMKNSSKLSLAFMCALHLTTSAGICGHFDLGDFDKETYKTHYNALPSVDENNALLASSPQFNTALKEAEEIVTRYELESTVGLRLIHRHFSLAENQVMAEDYEVIGDIPSLVTYAHTFEEAKEKGAVPASWIFSSNSQEELQIFESSNDSAVKRTNTLLQKSPEFFDEIGKKLEERQLNNLLSVAILKRDSLVAQKDQLYLEGNFYDQKRSIVQLWNNNSKPEHTIRTSWSFNGQAPSDCELTWVCVWSPDHKVGHYDRIQTHL